MATVLAHLHVDEAGRFTGQAPPSAPPGDYTATLEPKGAGPASRPPRQLGWPVHDCGPWPAGQPTLPPDDEPWGDSLSLRREDLHGDDGR